MRARLKSKSLTDSDGEPLYWNAYYGWSLIGGATVYNVDDKDNLLDASPVEFYKEALPLPPSVSYKVTRIPD